MALNGYLKGKNEDEEKADLVSWGWHYLRRNLNVWSDNVKLNYGKSPKDSVYIWKHMKKYVEELASICDGFRLTNTLDTPTNVTQYMLQAARSRNKNLYVISDLHSKSDT